MRREAGGDKLQDWLSRGSKLPPRYTPVLLCAGLPKYCAWCGIPASSVQGQPPIAPAVFQQYGQVLGIRVKCPGKISGWRASQVDRSSSVCEGQAMICLGVAMGGQARPVTSLGFTISSHSRCWTHPTFPDEKLSQNLYHICVFFFSLFPQQRQRLSTGRDSFYQSN